MLPGATGTRNNESEPGALSRQRFIMYNEIWPSIDSEIVKEAKRRKVTREVKKASKWSRIKRDRFYIEEAQRKDKINNEAYLKYLKDNE